MRLRIATFNVENLASRQSFGPRERPETAPALSLFDFPQAETREQVEASVAVAIEDDKRELTALAIAETRADIIALQEVDNLSVLNAFFANYVHRVSDIRYGHFKLVDGNDHFGKVHRGRPHYSPPRRERASSTPPRSSSPRITRRASPSSAATTRR